MKKSLFFVISMLMTINLYAYTDNDMDGVDDSVDQCPNTSLTDLVGINGCATRSLVSPHMYDVIVGLSYSDSDYRNLGVSGSKNLSATDTLATSFQFDYYYKQFSIQASTSVFKTTGSSYSDSGHYDSFLGASYRLNKINDLSISLSAGVILPTYDTELNNNNMDYTASVNLSRTIKKMNLFAGYSLTLVNDDDVEDITYQNTNAFNVGLGYYLSNEFYASVSYNLSDSIYRGVEDLETVSVYGYYTIDERRFTTFSYSHGLSSTASDNYISVRLGYIF